MASGFLFDAAGKPGTPRLGHVISAACMDQQLSIAIYIDFDLLGVPFVIPRPITEYIHSGKLNHSGYNKMEKARSSRNMQADIRYSMDDRGSNPL